MLLIFGDIKERIVCTYFCIVTSFKIIHVSQNYNFLCTSNVHQIYLVKQESTGAHLEHIHIDTHNNVRTRTTLEYWILCQNISRCVRDFPPVQTGPGAHPVFCKMGNGFLPEVKCDRDVLLNTHPLLLSQSWKSRAIPQPTLWATPGL